MKEVQIGGPVPVEAVDGSIPALLFLLLGLLLMVAGVFVLAGPGWALLAGGASCVVVALVLVLGVKRG